jgi:hypothetical protein
MYDAFSVAIFFEPVPGSPDPLHDFQVAQRRLGGINMVKRENILEGCRRFASGFKKILESPQLPEAEHLIDLYARIRALSDQDLTTKLQPIIGALKRLSRTDPALSRSDFQELIESGEYLNTMGRTEREHLLMSESVKLTIGQPSLLDKAL